MKSIYNKIFFTVFLVCLFSCMEEDNTVQSDKSKQATEALGDESGDSVDNPKSQSNEALFCDINNYQSYIYDRAKTDALIEETGKGCQLKDADFQNKSFVGAIFIQADFKGVKVQGTDFANAKLQGADLTGIIHDESTNFKGAERDDNTDLPGLDLYFAFTRDMVKVVESMQTSRRRWRGNKP